MAHRRLPQHMLPQPNPQPIIFSPSVARAAASTAKDWAYVDAWLKQKHHSITGRPAVPSFERNADTLRMLLALVAANETADEDKEQLFRAEDAALKQVHSAAAAKEAARHPHTKNEGDNDDDDDQGPADGALIVDDLLCAVEDNLTKEGRTALEAMAGMAVELGIVAGTDTATGQQVAITPELLASRFIELQASAVEVDRATARIEILHEHIRRETARLADVLDCMQDVECAEGRGSNVYQLDQAAIRQKAELHDKIRTMEAQLPKLEQQVEILNKRSQMPTVTVDEVKDDEDDYQRVLAHKKELDAQVKAFAGLPPDIDAARAELEHLRNELRSMTDRRDNNFERLVERESPAKPRRRM